MQHKKTSAADPQDWFDLAQDRLKAADLLWKHEGITPSGVECLQEAAERYLKGFLIAKGWQLVKTHDLTYLVGAAASLDSQFNQFSPMATELTQDFFEQHYPGGDMSAFGQNYNSMRSEAGQMIELIKTTLPQFFPK